MKESWQLDPVFRQEFLDACAKAATDDDAFNNFRKNDRIHTVIENTPDWYAAKAMDIMGWSPTIIRYHYIAFLIRKLFPRLEYQSIIEIGAGYGGLFEVFSNSYDRPISYTVYDLPEVIALQKRYLSERGATLGFPISLSEIKYHDKADLLISWCGWSELDRETKIKYFNEVIIHCDAVFIASNYNVPEDTEILSTAFDIQRYDDELVNAVLYGKIIQRNHYEK